MDYDDLDTSGTEEAVRVFVRIRPLNKREIAEKQTIGWNFNETSMLEDTPNGQRVYAYDHCFGPTATNQETYDIVGKPVVLKAMEGYNGTVFTCKYLNLSLTLSYSVSRWTNWISKLNIFPNLHEYTLTHFSIGKNLDHERKRDRSWYDGFMYSRYFRMGEKPS